MYFVKISSIPEADGHPSLSWSLADIKRALLFKLCCLISPDFLAIYSTVNCLLIGLSSL